MPDDTVPLKVARWARTPLLVRPTALANSSTVSRPRRSKVTICPRVLSKNRRSKLVVKAPLLVSWCPHSSRVELIIQINT